MRDVAAQRPCSVDGVEAAQGDELAGRFGELDVDPAFGEAGAQLGELQVHDAFDLSQPQWREQDDVVDAVEELGPEVVAQ